jgi:hypothetical protein
MHEESSWVKEYEERRWSRKVDSEALRRRSEGERRERRERRKRRVGERGLSQTRL